MMLSREFLNWKQAQAKVNHFSRKIRKGEKRKTKTEKQNKKPRNFEKGIKFDASGEKCIRSENLQNVQKMRFW